MQNILIVGGTGKTGRRIIRRLSAAGRPVRTASRTGGDIAFDLADPATWAPALEGVTAAYVVEPNLQASGDRIPRFVAEAVVAGVRRLVLLSAGGVGEADDRHPLKAAEQAVRASGLDWTILRPDWFSQNFSEGPGCRGSSPGRCPCLPVKGARRSSTPRTSPKSPRRRSPKTTTGAGSTS